MGNVFITYDVNDEPTNVILADCKRDVELALTFAKADCHRIEEIDLNKVETHNNLVFLLTSTKANSRTDFGHRSFGVDFRIWKRGI